MSIPEEYVELARQRAKVRHLIEYISKNCVALTGPEPVVVVESGDLPRDESVIPPDSWLETLELFEDEEARVTLELKKYSFEKKGRHGIFDEKENLEGAEKGGEGGEGGGERPRSSSRKRRRR